MVVPKPPVNLEGHCSVIHNNTLYTFSSNGFASIPLERNGTWSKLTMGEPVSDAVCVTGGMDGDEDQQALYVVGGTSATAKKPGLQRYSFKGKTWKTILSSDSVTSNRTSHSAVYLKSASWILVYGGDQTDGSVVTSDTYLLNTAPPYNISAKAFKNASPAVSPILLPWTDQEAALVGGLTSPTGVHLYNVASGWHDSQMTLKNEVPSGSKCSIVRRSDGSKILEVFDMDVSPNSVTSSEIVSSSEKKKEPSRKRKRNASTATDSYPEYDGTLGSSTKRQDYSLAQGDGSLVVISSGSGTDALAIFNQTSNSWVNATKLFYGDKSEQEILGTTTTSVQPTTTPTGSNSTLSEPSPSSNDSGSNIGTIIGATLGSLLGVAAILLLMLFFIKVKKNKLKKARGEHDTDKDRLSFQDRDVEPLTRSAYPMAQSPVPMAASSVDSLGIFSGKLGGEKSPRSAGALPQHMQRSYSAKPSPLITIQSSDDTPSSYSRNVDKAFEAQESLPSPGDRRTNEGWSKYFQDDSATSNFGGVQNPVEQTSTVIEPGPRGTLWPVGGKALPPLKMGFLEQPTPLGRVVTGSPTTEHASSIIDGRHITIPESQSARISTASSISINTEDDDFDEQTGPHDSNWQTQSWLGRPPSSTYSGSYYNSNQSARDLPSTTTGQTGTPNYRKHDSARTNTRGSSILIPHGEPLPRNNINSDMSWLNLQADR